MKKLIDLRLILYEKDARKTFLLFHRQGAFQTIKRGRRYATLF
jgi:hypothetical protein